MIPGFMREVFARETPFGRLSVLEDTVQRAHILVNAGTWHGWQFRDPDRLDEPTGYYASNSPITELFTHALPRDARVAVVGLGAGVTASLASPGHSLTFFEIDPAVIELARDERYFSFLARSKARCEIVEGDAVERITDCPARHFDLISVDAFFGPDVSGALLTRGAIERFVSRLRTDGVLAFHVTSTASGRDHRPELARLAPDLHLATRDSRSPRLPHDPTLEIDPDHDITMPTECRWVAMSPRAETVTKLVEVFGWTSLK